MTQRLCKVCRGWHETTAWPAGCAQRAVSKRGDFPVPMFTSDSMDPLMSHADGRMYDSRSEMLKHYADTGHRILEPGEKACRPAPPKTTDAEIRAALQTL